MSWIGEKFKEKVSQYEKRGKRHYLIHTASHNHFGGMVVTPNLIVRSFLEGSIGMAIGEIGLEILYRYSKCEHCEHYYGPPAIKRRVFKNKLFVLNCFCSHSGDNVTPESICQHFEPEALFAEMMLDEAKEVFKKRNIKWKFPEEGNDDVDHYLDY